MSRIGKKPVAVPSGVTASVDGQVVNVKGPKGAISLVLHGEVAAKAVGKLLAERAVKNGVTEVVFDRGGYLYHGRVKALADAARESGLSF